ncbi:hypothetical protein DX912_07625 [Lysobacter soli]|uniref:Knr4/Smi1-like domain-containing protein n=2 Tax=Lysobacter soli TaxID=453783 RepID=A0A3D8VG25_9GAMM|nr:hypothetical protein DX912_07625 [Lysobacter soli]
MTCRRMSVNLAARRGGRRTVHAMLKFAWIAPSHFVALCLLALLNKQEFRRGAQKDRLEQSGCWNRGRTESESSRTSNAMEKYKLQPPARVSMAGLASLTIVLLLAGCPGTSAVPTEGRGRTTTIARDSGYAASVAQWRDFLSCWDRDASKARQGRDDMGPALIAKGQGSPDVSLSARIKARERALGVELPRSYVDFLTAAQPDASWSELSRKTGLLSIDAIDTVARLDPEGVRIAHAHPLHASDETYFVYGVDQDSVVLRSSYFADAIVVGKYGDSLYEQIVLFPQVRTSDGEMEAALLGWSGVYRAPSFAEVMRQLSYHDLGRADHVPPYAQTSLAGTCADRLPQNNVWWK